MKGFYNGCLVVDATNRASRIEGIGGDILMRCSSGKGLTAWLRVRNCTETETVLAERYGKQSADVVIGKGTRFSPAGPDLTRGIVT